MTITNDYGNPFMYWSDDGFSNNDDVFGIGVQRPGNIVEITLLGEGKPLTTQEAVVLTIGAKAPSNTDFAMIQFLDDDTPDPRMVHLINSNAKILVRDAGVQFGGTGPYIDTFVTSWSYPGDDVTVPTTAAIVDYLATTLDVIDVTKVSRVLASDGTPTALSADAAGAVTIPVSLTLATGVTVDDVDNTPANDPTALITSQGVYNHTNATSNVHGLPSGAYVLGNKVGAGQFVESGTNNMTSASTNVTLSSSNSTGTCTFPVAFASAPIVVATAQDRALAFLGVSSITTSQFSWRWITNATASVTVTIGYIAIGS